MASDGLSKLGKAWAAKIIRTHMHNGDGDDDGHTLHIGVFCTSSKLLKPCFHNIWHWKRTLAKAKSKQLDIVCVSLSWHIKVWVGSGVYDGDGDGAMYLDLPGELPTPLHWVQDTVLRMLGSC